MKHLANLYFTPTTKINWPEGTIIDYLALDQVRINNGIYPPGGLLASWQYLSDSVISDEWRILPKLTVGERYRARFQFKSEGFWLSFGIIFTDGAGKTIKDYYSATKELDFTVPDGYVSYQIGLYGHGSGTVEFNQGEIISLDQNANSELKIDWLLEQQPQPQYLLINFEQPTLQVTAIDHWQTSLAAIPGVILHVTDDSPRLAHLIDQQTETFNLLKDEVARLSERWQFSAEQIFVSGLGIAARIARSFGQQQQLSTVIADPLIGEFQPNSLAADMLPLIKRSESVFDVTAVDYPTTVLVAAFDPHRQMIEQLDKYQLKAIICHDPESNQILHAQVNYHQYYQLQLRNWVLNKIGK